MYFLLLFATFLLTPTTHASSTVNVQTHVESNTDSKIEVNQQVSNTSSVSRKVEIDVNGEKHIYESNKEGSQTIKVESKDGKVNVTNTEDDNENVSPTLKISPTTPPVGVPSPTPVPDLLGDVPQTSLADYIIESIKDFFEKLF